MEFSESRDSENSEALPESFFDTLQSWALNFVQLVLEPIMNEQQRWQPSSQPEITVPKFSAYSRFTEEVSEPQSRDAALSVKQTQKQRSEKKLHDDVAFIILNVSYFEIWLVLASQRLQAKATILRIRADNFSAPRSDMTLQQLLKIYESTGCYNQLLEQYL